MRKDAKELIIGNHEIRDELGVCSVNEKIKIYVEKWREHLETMPLTSR